ncbi:MAG: YcxB family protein [Lachnospiraceae bacterium]|nr:YcxB family protein [Lachnospiraceae bacterium]
MNQKGIEFSVQMTVKEVYKYTLYHVYNGFSGRFGLIVSIAALVILVVNFSEIDDRTKTIFIILGLWFTVLEPLMALSRVKLQVKRNKAYQQPLNYRVDENGITVSQNEQSQSIGWDKLMKIVETQSQFLVYSSRIHSFIFPKSMMGGQEDAMRALILEYTKDTDAVLNSRIKRLGKKMTSQNN